MTEWRRPHPFTLLIELVSAVRDLIIPIVFVLFQLGGLGFEDYAGLLVIAMPAGAAAARYFSTRYALTDEALLNRHGVLRRTSQVLPRQNIQSLSTSAGLIARATGLVELTVSDASLGGDVQLRLLSAEEANRIMVLLRADMAERDTQTVKETDDLTPATGQQFAPPSPAGQAAEAPPVHENSTTDLVKYTLLTSLPGAVLGVSLSLGIGLWLLLDSRGVLPDELGFRRGSLPVIATPIFILAVTLAQPVFALGGFRLWSEPDRLRIKTGLLTEVQFTARRERIQRVRVQHHLFGKPLQLEQIAFTTADVEGSSSSAEFMAPTTAWGDWPHFAADALGSVELREEDLLQVSPLTFRRQLIRFGLGGVPLVAAFAILLALVPSVRLPVVFFGLLLLVVYGTFAVWFSRRRADRLGYAVGSLQFLARTGVINEALSLVNKDKVQALGIQQSIFQRRLGLADLRLVTAGRGGAGVTTVPDLALPIARHLLVELGAHSAQTPQAIIL